jgi:hypothetical protein
MTDTKPALGAPADLVLGPLPPQREGQYLTMTICGPADDPAECGHWSSPAHVQRRIDKAVAAELERIKAAVMRCTLFAENCDDDGPEVDIARNALVCTIFAAIAGYEAPPPVGTTGSLF